MARKGSETEALKLVRDRAVSDRKWKEEQKWEENFREREVGGVEREREESGDTIHKSEKTPQASTLHFNLSQLGTPSSDIGGGRAEPESVRMESGSGSGIGTMDSTLSPEPSKRRFFGMLGRVRTMSTATNKTGDSLAESARTLSTTGTVDGGNEGKGKEKEKIRYIKVSPISSFFLQPQ
jgi:hypothetical protein